MSVESARPLRGDDLLILRGPRLMCLPLLAVEGRLHAVEGLEKDHVVVVDTVQLFFTSEVVESTHVRVIQLVVGTKKNTALCLYGFCVAWNEINSASFPLQILKCKCYLHDIKHFGEEDGVLHVDLTFSESILLGHSVARPAHSTG